MAQGDNAEFFEVGIRKLWQNVLVYRVCGESFGVLTETEFPQPL